MTAPAPLTIFVATDRTRDRDGDFGDAPTGEPVALDLACDHPDDCDCARAFVGLVTGKRTSTAVVTRAILSAEQLASLLMQHYIARGIATTIAGHHAGIDAAALNKAADQFAAGTVVDHHNGTMRERSGSRANHTAYTAEWLAHVRWQAIERRRATDAFLLGDTGRLHAVDGETFTVLTRPSLPLDGPLPALPARATDPSGPPRLRRDVAEYLVAALNAAHHQDPDHNPLAYWFGPSVVVLHPPRLGQCGYEHEVDDPDPDGRYRIGWDWDWDPLP